MTRKSANSLLNSLKGKIRLAACALAFFICTFGLISYLAVSFLTSDMFFAVFIPFLIPAGAAVIFGWWLSNEVVHPIEKISLLARSLERGTLVALPKTSGSTETDELLRALHRNSTQIQTVVGLMEAVAAGDLNVALAPLQNSDRLSGSFQKLLAKVADSIQAKKDLEELRGALNHLTTEVSPVRGGNFDIEIKTDAAQTKELAETFRFLIEQFGGLVAQIKSDALASGNTAVELKKTIETVLETDENRIRQFNKTASAFEEISNGSRKISQDVFDSAVAGQSIEQARMEAQAAARKNVDSVGALRLQIQESARRVSRLGEHSQEIAAAAKEVEDLARRTNLIALNAAVQSSEPSASAAQNRGVAILAEEIERLAARAENANRQISTLGKSLAADVGAIEHSIRSAGDEATNLSKFAVERENSLIELERYAARFLTSQTKLVAFANQNADDCENAVREFADSLPAAESTLKNLKKSDVDAARLANLTENLQAAVGDFKIAETERQSQPPRRLKAAETIVSDVEIVEIAGIFTPEILGEK